MRAAFGERVGAPLHRVRVWELSHESKDQTRIRAPDEPLAEPRMSHNFGDRAAQAGMTLPECLLADVEQVANRPTIDLRHGCGTLLISLGMKRWRDVSRARRQLSIGME